MGSPLLRHRGSSAVADTSRVESCEQGVRCSSSFALSDECLSELRAGADAAERGQRVVEFLVWCQFALSTCTAAYIGAKCVCFRSDVTESFRSIRLGLGVTVLLCHGSFYAMRKAVQELTRGVGISIPSLHMHDLFVERRAEQRMCQTCRAKIRPSNHDATALYCPACITHYYCIQCVKRHLANRSAGDRSLASEADIAMAGASRAEESPHMAYLKKFAPLIRPFWHWTLLANLAILANQLVSIIMPGQQGRVIDAIVATDADRFKEAILMYLLINLLNGLGSAAQSSAVLLVCRKLIFRTREMVYSKILEQDMTYFDENLSGQIISHLTSDADRMTDPVNLIMNNVVTNLLRLAGGMVMCFSTSWEMSILALTAIFPITYIVNGYTAWAGKIWRKVCDNYSEAMGAATEAVQNVRTVRCFGAESLEKKRFETFLTQVYKLDMMDTWMRTGTLTLNSYLDLAIGVFVLWYGGFQSLKGSTEMTLGRLITFQLYWTMMKNAFNGLNDVGSSMLRATSSAYRVIGLLEMKASIADEGDELNPESVKGDVVLDDICFDYAEKRSVKSVLRGVSLTINSGQVTALVGKSGSGKSTIASLLLRLYDVTGGAISLDGRDLRSLRPSALRACIGVVQQDTQLFAGSIADNIAYAAQRSYSTEEIQGAADQSNALGFISTFSDGLNSLCGDRGVKLSGGQKQRIAIARIFLRRPPILILDEATSALDAENESIVQHAIDRLVESGVCRTVLVIAHRLSTVRHAHQIAVLQEGQLVELGTHDLLMQKADGIYAQLVSRQIAAFQEAASIK
eukprot:TRINITY_DN40031_c0_g1_i1.p1 TRINITY_DN40031_c0_g1~~TRINITY_DN40031_c0_g1_i1.p1  ORF type:complete len:927 (+),score=141.24 TRINITY_DN40031_c0_g1_i1:379-2781(+)